MTITTNDGARRATRPRRRLLMAPALALLVLVPTALGTASMHASSMPSSPTDESSIPHYFGPYPNWANSPLVTPAATVTIAGDGQGAEATATIGGNGAVTDLTVTKPGSGYHSATVTISGPGSGATATATIRPTGGVTAVTLSRGGNGYTDPELAFAGGGTTLPATAHLTGGVDAITLVEAGSGYTFPTVDFDLPHEPGGTQASGHVTCAEALCRPATANGFVHITGVVVDDPGSGYTSAPGVAVLDGTQFSPVDHSSGGFAKAKATATLKLQGVVIDDPGAGYTSAPTVSITDSGSGWGARATARVDTGAIGSLTLTNGGSGYVTSGGMKKFQDTLPGLGEAGKNNLGQYLPVAEPDTKTFAHADYYVVALVQHRERMSSSLPRGTLLREYVQLATDVVPGKRVALSNDMPDGSSVPAKMPDGSRAYGVDDPHYLGPIVSSTKNRPVRIVFYNLLPTGSDGDLFLPMDSTMMGSGMGPMKMAASKDQHTVMDAIRNPECTRTPKPDGCYKENRATLHLHGGTTPWISDGTAHQWITPAGEATEWPRGVSVAQVPDMVGAARPAGVPDCTAAHSGCQSFYYTNQQSARLLWYHDHSWGITRLNVYAGEAGGYLVTDPTEKKLVDSGTIPSEQIPLLIQDRTFVPSKEQLAEQDPTWDYSRWGSEGDLWYHHVYMPAQNPADPSGLSAFGRWMYGPYFWPPADPPYGPIANPYYDPSCNLDEPATWQYQSEPYCEPARIPGTPNIAAGMEQFNDTPLVNGTAYPTTTVEPKAYRFRIANVANDRFWNLQWYVADPTTGTDSEVALKANELAAAQSDPVVFPTPDTSISPEGPNFVQIGSEGGFLPAPAVIPNQPITWITDPTRFDVGNVDLHALLLAPAERADAIVDFSRFAGKTLILYNDAPAAFPARVACYDYYTGGPDLSPACAPSTIPGYGPNTRTIMRVKVAASTPAAPFDVKKLRAAFTHHADGSGVFESGQHPIVVGQAGYNTAYATKFAASGDCSKKLVKACDGFARIYQQGDTTFSFDTLLGKKLAVMVEPKAIHDEMNAAAFDEYGRMTANIGVESTPATPVNQNVTLYPFVNPQTEMIDGTNLPDTTSVTPIAAGTDGSQIWKITHNGVDTHPIHFHLFDVQVIDRVTWDGIILPPDPNELGWKDTVRVSPLEDTYVVMRPVIPTVPFELPNAIRPLNPMMPLGDTSMFNSIDVQGNPLTNPITNELVNFGWEYVWHCHILSHEEMDMMRPMSLVMPPRRPDGLDTRVTTSGGKDHLELTWSDNSINETAFVVQRTTDGRRWTTVGTSRSPLNRPNVHGTRSLVDPATYTKGDALGYRVVAENVVGYGNGMPSMTASSTSATLAVGEAPAAPAITSATATLAGNGERIRVAWNPVPGATSYLLQWSTSPSFSVITGTTTTTRTTARTRTIAAQSWYVRVVAANVISLSQPSAPELVPAA